MRYPLSTTFFDSIARDFGRNKVRLMKMWCRLNRKYIRISLSIWFLRMCLNFSLVPQHLSYVYKPSFSFFCGRSVSKQTVFANRFVSRTLHNELHDTYRHIKSISHNIRNIKQELTLSLPHHIVECFFDSQVFPLNGLWKRERNRICKKIEWLMMNKKRTEIEKIKQISYVSVVTGRKIERRRTRTRSRSQESQISPTAKKKFSFSSLPCTTNEEHNKITLEPDKFVGYINNDPTQINKKWIINLSNTNIPEEVQGILQLGGKYCLPTRQNKDRLAIEFIKHVETNIRTWENNKKSTIRNHTVNAINNLLTHDSALSQIQHQIHRKEKVTRAFLKEHPDLLITRADKGSITVVISKDQYLGKMLSQLTDRETYTIVNVDPTHYLQSTVNSLVKRWYSNEWIRRPTYRALLSSDKNLPRAYGLPKVHKPGAPLRIIISAVNSPLYELASYVHFIINKNVPKGKGHILNSFELVSKLENIRLEEHYHLASLDVVSLFTNVPNDLALKSIKKRWRFIKTQTMIPEGEFLEAVELILDSSFFTFNNVTYKQTFGSPMGSPLSPIIADLVLQDLEEWAINRLPIPVPLYFRYVDDILLAAPKKFLTDILRVFNAFHTRLQFTLETSDENKINFLDLTIIADDGCFTFDWYRKPTFSGRYLNFTSQHSISHKKGVIVGLVDRIFWLSHPRFHEKNLEFIINTLLTNCYPLSLIFETTIKRLGFLFEKKMKNSTKTSEATAQNVDDDEDNNKKFFVVPYVQTISESFNPALHDEFRMAFVGQNNLGKYVRAQKDPLPKQCNSGVVYQINCNSCDASYVGQTGRRLQTRIKEHQRSNLNTVVGEHRSLKGHDFNWEETQILDVERSWHKRLISEMIHIKKQPYCINSQNDTVLLDNIYLPIINKLRSRLS